MSKRRWMVGEHRPVPGWIREVEWPADTLEFRGRVSLANRRRVAKRILGFIMLAPPVMSKPGGGLSARHKQRSFAKREAETEDLLKTFIAVEIAEEIAAYELKGHHRDASSTVYRRAFRRFRVLSGFGRLLGAGGISDRDPTRPIEEWPRLLAAFCVFDLFYRLGGIGQQARPLQTETAAQQLILLRQDMLGLKIGSASLAAACRQFRSVSHLLVGLFSAMRAEADGAAFIKELGGRAPSPAELARKMAPSLVKGLAWSQYAQVKFGTEIVKGRGAPLVQPRYQVSIPSNVRIPGGIPPYPQTLQDEEMQLALALSKTRLHRGGTITLQSITSNNAARMRLKLLGSVRS